MTWLNMLNDVNFSIYGSRNHFISLSGTSCKVGAVAARKPMCHCGRKADLKPVGNPIMAVW